MGTRAQRSPPRARPALLLGARERAACSACACRYCDASYVASTRLDRPTYFKSEFGQCGLPAFETLAPALNGSRGDFNVFSPIMMHRKHAGATLAKPIQALFIANSSADHKELSTSSAVALNGTSEAAFRRTIFLSQLAQTLCIKSYMEELRRGNNTFGALIWQLNGE
jgi:hypothetical protein